MTIEEYHELIELLNELAEQELVARKTCENLAENQDSDEWFRNNQIDWAAKHGIMYSRIQRAIRNVKSTHVIMHLE